MPSTEHPTAKRLSIDTHLTGRRSGPMIVIGGHKHHYRALEEGTRGLHAQWLLNDMWAVTLMRAVWSTG
jgi:hypothetical protein